jgi:tetratricopeptide (TPR) repeat protein
MTPDHNYETQILLEEATYTIADDGTMAYRHRIIYRVDSAEGVQHWSEISAQWDPWFEKPAQLGARVLQADGRFAELDQKTVTDAPINAEDDETFSSEHVRRAPLPGVAVGSIVEQVQEVDEKIPYFAGGGIYRFFFREGVPLGHVRVVVDMPAALPFKEAIHELPALVVERNETGGRRHVVYESGPQPAAHNSDIDLATNEPEAPMVEFATGASWASLAAEYAAIANPLTVEADTQPILPTALPDDRMGRIRAIVIALHQEVRYTGVEFGAARLTPQRPSEVLKRHYGDCKDKATFLVAMLRAAGIPANLALLDTGPGRDVDPALPGMNRFDHAIVYVPAGKDAKKEPALWIDATAQYFQPGSLPFQDQGRSALVIAPGTVGLLRTPDPKPEDSKLVETRVFTLAANGPSHVVETSETYGSVDANYRGEYGGQDTETGKLHTELENYVHNAYLAKTLVRVTHGDAADLSQPFHLTIEADGAKRGITALDEAEVVIFPTMPLNSMPKWFSQPPYVVGPETSAEIKHQLELAQAARVHTYTMRPFVAEHRVRIVIPDGFALRSLPADKTTPLGTATMTESYAANDPKDPGVVTAVFKLDSGPATMTAEQALAMRTAVLEYNKRDFVGIFFDQVGAKAFAAGKIREALDADRALIAAHPSEALNHARLARLLLQAGIGDAAHAEARKATELDPKSATAFNTLGWTLEHDSLGVRFGKGYDLAGAIAAYKQAIALDPDDNDYRFSLAILYEFDARGTRYSSDANIPAAIAVYRELVDRTKDKEEAQADQYRENLLYSLFFAKQFAELDKMLATMPFNNAHAALSIASAAAQHGAAAGIAQADKGNVAAADRNKNLRAAGSLMSQLRRYPEAAELLSAGIGGGGGAGDDAPTTARQIELYKSLKQTSLNALPASDPASPVQTIMFGVMAGTLTKEQATKALARSAYTSEEARQRDVDKNLSSSGFLRMVASKSDMTEPVLLDLIAGNMTFTSTGDDASGYAVIGQEPGSDPSHYFVIKEDGAFRVVADDHDATPVGNEVLYALEHNNTKLAKTLLDWKRDLTHKAGGDDPFDGPLLPRFWTVNSSKPGADSPAAMRLAAISMLAGSMDAKPYLAEVAAAREKANGQRQTDLDLLLADAGIGCEAPDVALPAAKRLLEQEPDSLTALRDLGQAFAYQGNAKAWLEELAPRLARKPKDHDLLSEQARAYQLAHDWPAARKAEQGVLDSGKADSSDYNSFAWMGLFDNHIGDDSLKAAQQSNMLTKNGNFAELHTLACIYAAEGRTTEARQVLDQAMQAGNQTEPNSSVWYALGLIYEQYGAKDAALVAYRKVDAHELDDHTYVDPMSTWLLAQDRIKALAAK